jgi:hypothetical protein
MFVESEPAHSPTPGDVSLAVEIVSGGFSGRGAAWVDAQSLNVFIGRLRALDELRNGIAQLDSMSPGEFSLRLYSSDLAGHMAICGRLCRGKHALEFAFGFCPSRLPGIVAGFASMERL